MPRLDAHYHTSQKNSPGTITGAKQRKENCYVPTIYAHERAFCPKIMLACMDVLFCLTIEGNNYFEIRC